MNSTNDRRGRQHCPYPNCAAANPPDARYCARCGRPLNAPAEVRNADGWSPPFGWGTSGLLLALLLGLVLLVTTGPWLGLWPLLAFGVFWGCRGTGRCRRTRRHGRFDHG